MSAENETIADIVAWIRKHPCMFGYGDMNALADRIEAAAGREVKHALEHATRHAEAVAAGNCRDCVLRNSNAEKLREALISVQKKIYYLIGSLTVPNSLVANRMEINGIINAVLDDRGGSGGALGTIARRPQGTSRGPCAQPRHHFGRSDRMTRKLLAALFGFVAGIVTAPLALVAWPFMVAVFLWNEEGA